MTHDIEEMKRLLSMYREGKITKFALEKELNTDVYGMAIPSQVNIEFDLGHVGSSGSTYLMAVKPYFSPRSGATIIVDNNALSIFTDAEIIDGIVAIIHSLPNVMSIFYNMSNDGDTVFKALEGYIRLFKSSLETAMAQIQDPERKKALSQAVMSDKDFEDLLAEAKGETLPIGDFKEKLMLLGTFPTQLVKEAEDLAMRRHRESVTEIHDDFLRDDDPNIPTANKYHDHRKKYVDGTYDHDKLNKEIPFDYKPSTNQ
jgi:hypothetical protein